MSATSSPAASPSSRGYASPSPPRSPGIDLTVTPRTKIKLMLASMEDSDSDSAEPVSRLKLKPSPKQKGSPGRSTSTPAVNDDEDDEDDMPVVRHRARNTNKTVDSDNDDVDMQDVNTAIPKMSAADRIRQQLYGNKADTDEDQASDKDDEEETPKPARRRLLKKKSSPIRTQLTSPARGLAISASSPPKGSSPPKPLPQKKSGKKKEKAARKSKKSKKPATVESGSGSDAAAQSSDSDSDPLASLDEDDSLDNLFEEGKLMRLVNEKRKANQAKEAAEEAKRQARMEAAQLDEDDMDQIYSDGSDKPKTKRPAARKASKKAELEMRAETQRLARNQKLRLASPERKKLPVSDLWSILGGFNPKAPPATSQPDSSANSLPNTSEIEQSTSPSSTNVSPNAKANVDAAQGDQRVQEDAIVRDVNDMPSLEELMKESYAPKEETTAKGKERAVDQDVKMLDIPKGQKLGFSALPKLKDTQKPVVDEDSDSDDLEIIPPPVIARPVPKSDPLKDLRRIARLDHKDSGRTNRGRKGPVKDPNWEINLVKKAKEQIKADEEEKMNQLRAQGFEVLTEAEKVKEILNVENYIDKARQEADEQRERERREEARSRGIRLADLSEDSDEDDGSWQGSDDEPELSGSEDSDAESNAESEEAADEEMKEVEEVNVSGTPPSAQRPSSPLRLPESDDEEMAENLSAAPVNSRRQRARAVVKDDDDEDDEDEEEESTAKESITQVPSSTTTSPQKPAMFGNFQAAGLPISLTQMFNSSMESESVPASMPERSQKSVPFTGFGGQAPVIGLTQMFESSMDSQPVPASIPERSQKNAPLAGFGGQGPVLGLTQMFESSMDSQANGSVAQNRMDQLREDIPDSLNISQIPLEAPGQETQIGAQDSLLDLNYSQSQIQFEPESLLDPTISGGQRYIPEPTPDMGFQYDPAAAPPRFEIPQSQLTDTQSVSGTMQSGFTEPTVILSPEEPAPRRKKGKLIRKIRAQSEDVDGSENANSDGEDAISGQDEPANAFDILGKKKKKVKIVDNYDKKNSKAKNLFQEDAEESEDEYQGLGGNSDEEETDEEALAEMEEMIDDETKDLDDGQHAELDLKRAVVEDEKNVQKIMKDIKHGNLRKRRGQGFDLDDDSDDAEEERRERRRQRNAAERRRLLLQDDNISKLAENSKRQAFLKVIEEDRSNEKSFLDDEEDYDFAVHEDTQKEEETEVTDKVPDSQPIAVDESEKTEKTEKAENVNPRRTSKKRKTATSLQVQRTVSSLLDDGMDTFDPNLSSDSDLEIEGIDTLSKRPRLNYIDRVAEKRSATTTSDTAKQAFSRGSATDPTGVFKVPALLRRSTTQTISETTTVAPKTAFVETTTKMKKAKGSGATFNYQYREAAKQKSIEKVASSRRKEEKKVMGARRADAANVFNAGGFA
ncbi:hypothetical protein TWF694_004951 [Orbilia ellipsospora]|uniref:DNA replication checkpoint mediator MRC1 domain-containing protein n=1 Tax=Orbilia ellipsospora TaxID=2528407 RepID=A0AAV9WUE4_9PEZI